MRGGAEQADRMGHRSRARSARSAGAPGGNRRRPPRRDCHGPPPRRPRGLLRPLRFLGTLCLLPALPLSTACDVSWGGGRVALEDPAPEPETPEPEGVAEPAEAPLPRGPLLFAVRAEGTRALAVPVARIGAGLEPLEVPGAVSDRWRARFDSVFLAPGIELRLQTAGTRVGTLVVEGARVPDPACPSVADGTLFLVPGQQLPPLVFATPAEVPAPRAGAVPLPGPDRRMAVAGPVIAERLIGGPRAFLARRAALAAVPVPGDAAPGLGGTWLVSDSLAPGPPGDDAVSLLFFSRWEPTRGYRTQWSLIRRYDSAEDKEVFEYVDWIRLPTGGAHLLRRVDGTSVGLAAVTDVGVPEPATEAVEAAPEEAPAEDAGGAQPAAEAEPESDARAEVGWAEEGACRAEALLRAAAGAGD